MRYHNLRYDVWLCLLLSVFTAFGVSKMVRKILSQKYDAYEASHKVSKDSIGGIAGEEIFKAQNIEDLFSHDKFTILSPGIEYRNKGAGYYKNFYMYLVVLPSGEKVAARINTENVVSDNESIYSGTSTLPVGRLIKEDLTKEKTFMEQIEYNYKLDRTDFYIDMVGEASVLNADSFIEVPTLFVQLLVIFFTFTIFHTIGSKIGIFPYFFVPKSIKKSDWE